MLSKSMEVKAMMLLIIAISTFSFGIVHGVQAETIEETRIDERFTAEDFRTEDAPETPQEQFADELEARIGSYLPDVPTPLFVQQFQAMLEDRMIDGVVVLGNAAFWLAERGSVFGYHNKWISPTWLVWWTKGVMFSLGGWAILRQVSAVRQMGAA